MQQEQKWVVAGDMLFPEGGYQLTANGKQALNQYVPKLQNLQNAKIVVYGYTDNLPVGPALQRAGIPNNLVLSSRRAAADRKSVVSGGSGALSRWGSSRDYTPVSAPTSTR